MRIEQRGANRNCGWNTLAASEAKKPSWDFDLNRLRIAPTQKSKRDNGEYVYQVYLSAGEISRLVDSVFLQSSEGSEEETALRKAVVSCVNIALRKLESKSTANA